MRIDNTYNDLVKRVADELRQIIQHYQLETKDEERRAPQVFEGYMPERTSQRDSQRDYPAVIVRFLKSKNNIDKSTKIGFVRLIIGVYSEDSGEGWRLSLGIAERIELELQRKGFLGPFAIENEIEIDLPEEQAAPFWFAAIDLQLGMPQMQTQIDWGNF